MPLQEGSAAPDFKLKAVDGSIVELSSFKGKKNVVVYFYPKDDTPGCTKEACNFRDDYSDLHALDVEVLGVSTDNLESHDAFAKKFFLKFPLLSDPDGVVSKAYDAYNEEKKMSRRVTAVIDKEGKIKKYFATVNPEIHSKEVIGVFHTTF